MRAVLMAMAVVPLLVGCSQVPKPSAYPMSYQQKMQAAHHWELLARDVAAGVATDYVGLVGGGVYVEPSTGVFGHTYTEMLKTELVRQGVALAGVPHGAAVLSFDVQVIKFRATWPDRQNRRNPGFWTGIAVVIRTAKEFTKNMIIPGGVLLDAAEGTMVTLPAHEIVITTSLEKDGAFVMRRSDLYYVNDVDAGQYALRYAGDTKTLEVVAQ